MINYFQLNSGDDKTEFLRLLEDKILNKKIKQTYMDKAYDRNKLYWQDVNV